MSQTPLASLLFAPDGTARGLYTEAIELWRLGRLHVTRATRVTFDNRLQVWRVRDRTGFALYTSPSRQACLDWEQKHFLAQEDL